MSNDPPVKKSSNNFGSPLLPACEPRLLIPIDGKHGTLKVIPIQALELHAVCLDGHPLAMHANGYSVHNLAERIVKAWETEDYERAEAQREYINQCGGITLTQEKFFYCVRDRHVSKPCEP